MRGVRVKCRVPDSEARGAVGLNLDRITKPPWAFLSRFVFEFHSLSITTTLLDVGANS